MWVIYKNKQYSEDVRENKKYLMDVVATKQNIFVFSNHKAVEKLGKYIVVNIKMTI